jgi:predicted DsbA family dithiol-disulfide isomerase
VRLFHDATASGTVKLYEVPKAPQVASDVTVIVLCGDQMALYLFENRPRFSARFFLGLAQELGLPATALREALESGKFAERVRSDFSGGVRSGVNGTPTFFINGRRHDGPFDFESLVAAIEEESRTAKSAAGA